VLAEVIEVIEFIGILHGDCRFRSGVLRHIGLGLGKARSEVMSKVPARDRLLVDAATESLLRNTSVIDK